MFAIVDRLTGYLALIAAWLFVATGAMLIFEVTARYLFNAPTIWAEELSRFFLIWATFMSAAALLRQRQHIQITIITERLPDSIRRILEIFAMAVVVVLCAVAFFYGFDIMYDSLEVGRTTGSMMDMQLWWTEASIPFGFGLLGMQALIEMAKLLSGAPLPKPASESH